MEFGGLFVYDARVLVKNETPYLPETDKGLSFVY